MFLKGKGGIISWHGRSTVRILSESESGSLITKVKFSMVIICFRPSTVGCAGELPLKFALLFRLGWPTRFDQPSGEGHEEIGMTPLCVMDSAGILAIGSKGGA